jgi:lipid II:glycine glycyltransferase (peptidoglycan interpeptide bridge formation enzyme)
MSSQKFKVNEINDKQVWENFLESHPETNFLQSWNWGEFNKNLDKKISRLGFYSEKGELVGVMLSVVEDARRGRYLTVPGGPVIDWQNKALTKYFVKELNSLCYKLNCIFARVRPQLLSDKSSQTLFRELGFRASPMHLHAELTSQLDLTQDEETMLKNMRKQTRYEIRQADKKDITITTSTSEKDLKAFYDLQADTARRQSFVPFSYKYLHEQFKVFANDNQVVLYSAFQGKKLLAQAFVIFYGAEAAYHYGASTPDGRKLPGAYAIQWAAIREAKKRGMKRYNFWGVTHPNETNHRFYGVSIFKRGFGGYDVEYLHAHDLVVKTFRYSLNWMIETVRKKVRRV